MSHIPIVPDPASKRVKVVLNVFFHYIVNVVLCLKFSNGELIQQEMRDAIRNGNSITTTLLFSFEHGGNCICKTSLKTKRVCFEWRREPIYSTTLQKHWNVYWWGLLADRYGLPKRDYWQTVHKICKRSANPYLGACHLRPATFPKVPGS